MSMLNVVNETRLKLPLYTSVEKLEIHNDIKVRDPIIQCYRLMTDRQSILLHDVKVGGVSPQFCRLTLNPIPEDLPPPPMQPSSQYPSRYPPLPAPAQHPGMMPFKSL